MTKYYKVCKKIGNQYWSVCSISDHYIGLFRPIEYKLNETSFPHIENSKIFVFDNLEAATKFAKDGTTCVVFEVDVTNPTPAQVRSYHWFLESIEAFWNNQVVEKAFCPSGTVFVDSVTLTKLVYDKGY
jgi:hypothetical protein